MPTSKRSATGKSKTAKSTEAPATLKRRVKKIIALLRHEYPDATCALDHRSPYELLVATILSAQCTDKRVNMVTPALFKKYPDAAALAHARTATLEKIIQSTGFFRNKSKNLIGCAQGIVANHGGEVPDTMEALTALDGVGRKTANVVLGNAFGKNIGVVVDTHVGRISRLLGFTESKNAEIVERELMEIVPQQDWTDFSHLLIYHGRAVCIARRPACDRCALYDYCPGRAEH